ncbi:protein NLRC3-like [Dysidea avara]|uniref:protein NLRC3-like n=1 Tax=Dysidea avara TaxID=196820 RepID=UPI0033185698
MSQRNLKELNLKSCAIGDHGICLLHHYLCGNTPSKLEITTIDLSGNNLTEASSSLIGDIICHIHPQNVYLAFNKITAIRNISTAVINTNTVKTLALNNNTSCITVQDAPAISDMMVYLEKLRIDTNALGDEGAIILSEGIMRTTTLKSLYLGYNDMSATGVIAISKCLKHNTSLQLLSMDGNFISEDVATAIAQALTENKTLKGLSLWHSSTPINDEPAMIILKTLHYNHSVTTLRVYYYRHLSHVLEREVEAINYARRKYNIEELMVSRKNFNILQQQ